MNTNIKVSILVPIYGVEKYIERCARSLFEQTYTNIEYNFVNDCTKDNSVEVLKKIMKDYPGIDYKVRIINHEHNRGLAAARNTAVDCCTGEYLMHVDSDDWLEKTAVEKCVGALVDKQYDIVYFDVLVHFKKYVEYYRIPEEVSKEILLKKMLSSEIRTSIYGALIKRTLYTINEIKVQEGINNSEDFQVAPKLLYYSSCHKSLGEVLYNYERRNESSITYSFSERNSHQNWESIKIISDFFSKNDSSYLSCIEKRKVFFCFDEKKNCLITGGHMQYYNDVILPRIESINKKSWELLPESKRVFMLIHNTFIARVYIKSTVWINSLIKTIKG